VDESGWPGGGAAGTLMDGRIDRGTAEYRRVESDIGQRDEKTFSWGT
jgi:hypothetical protein